jgi:hypothetical protein
MMDVNEKKNKKEKMERILWFKVKLFYIFLTSEVEARNLFFKKAIVVAIFNEDEALPNRSYGVIYIDPIDHDLMLIWPSREKPIPFAPPADQVGRSQYLLLCRLPSYGA